MTDIPKDVLRAADAAFQDCRYRNEHDHEFRTGSCCLRAAVTAALHVHTAEQWAQQQADQLGLKYADFRAGKWEMELSMAREMGAAYTAMAKTLFGDAPNYTETKICFDTKIAESPETYTLVVQRHAPGALTPHEARQKAEARVAELEQLVTSMCASLNGHEPPVPEETPMQTVTRFVVRLMETERELAEAGEGR